jgi:hypothetical protein
MAFVADAGVTDSPRSSRFLICGHLRRRWHAVVVEKINKKKGKKKNTGAPRSCWFVPVGSWSFGTALACYVG